MLFSPPTITYCENNITGLISQPGNSWSNLFYLFVGLYLMYLARNGPNKLLRIFPVFPILIGIFSFIYHASYSFSAQLLDLGSMFLFISFLLVLSIKRFRPNLTDNSLVSIYFLTNIISLSLIYLVGVIFRFNLGIPLFGLLVLGVIGIECLIYQKNKHSLRDLWLAVITFIIAFSFWLVDYIRIWCDPNYFHLINGHALWHITNSLCFIPIYRFYAKNLSR